MLNRQKVSCESSILPADSDDLFITVMRSGPRVRRCERQFKGEGGATTRTVTMNGKDAAQFLRGERAAMQAEAVPIPPGGEPVTEDPGEILRSDADAVVSDFNSHHVFAGEMNSEGDEL